jgi:hypothetical protein
VRYEAGEFASAADAYRRAVALGRTDLLSPPPSARTEIGDSPLFLTKLPGYRLIRKRGLSPIPFQDAFGEGDVQGFDHFAVHRDDSGGAPSAFRPRRSTRSAQPHSSGCCVNLVDDRTWDG